MTRGANQVRIIGGRHRGRRIGFLPGRGLRPTPDRVRETLFNWLQADIAGARCLDLFAGSGALGLEALSRGAAFLLAVERHPASVARLREHLQALGETSASVVQADALRLLEQPPAQPFDIVFVDPPFADDLVGRVIERLEAGRWLAADALVYLEQDASRDWPPLPAGWQDHRAGSAGQSGYRLLRRSTAR